MIYLKGVLVGVIAALVASAIYVPVVFVLPFLIPFVLSRITGGGIGFASASVSTGPLLAIAVVAFALGFSWEVKAPSGLRPRSELLSL